MPRFTETFCSQCGASFGPGDSGYSHCIDHRPMPEHDTPWTPGPWRIHVGPVTGTLHIVTGSVGHIVCNIHGAAPKRYEDARLIAAAPALYEALAGLVAEFGKRATVFPASTEDAIETAHAALALARGETK